MLLLRKTLALAAILISLCAPTPVIRIQNTSKQNICYMVEYSNGTGAFPNVTWCGGEHGFKVAGFMLNSGLSKDFTAIGSDGQRFDGAITAWPNNSTRGARNEINLLNVTETYYDVDYQRGISGSTCGPANDSSALDGEPDPLAEANKAWNTLSRARKMQLLAFPTYLQGNNRALTYINMDINAWPFLAPGEAARPVNPKTLPVVAFFQQTANFNAYMCPGSIKGVTPPNNFTKELVALADGHARKTPMDHMVITSY